MSGTEDKDQTDEYLSIIIKKKKGGHGDGHHGGVWKIAYADFMTAMMAFFLVMWLINASNEETRTQVASYFNPVRLVDAKPTKKGLSDPQAASTSTENASTEQTDEHAQSTENKSIATPHHTPVPETKAQQEKREKEEAQALAEEAEILKNPYGVLDQIFEDYSAKTEKERGMQAAQPNIPKGPSPGTIDPFGSSFWKGAGEAPTAPAQTQPPSQPNTAITLPSLPSVKPSLAEQFKEQAKEAEKPVPAPPQKQMEQTATQQSSEPAKPSPFGTPLKDRLAQQKREAVSARLLKQLEGLEKTLGPEHVPGFRVQAEHGGVLVSLTDRASFEMFSISSSKPRPEMIALMEKLAETLEPLSSRIVIRGHTDSRPFRTGTRDNWSLSTARAQMAYYMLRRAGLSDDRFQKIEGFADRDPLDPKNPESPENRRIEIFLYDPPKAAP